jgi:hypothetical protein
MKRLIRSLLFGVLLVAAWTMGQAQAESGDFVIEVAAAGGAKLTCVKGCALVGGRDVTISKPESNYTYACSSMYDCKATVHGFIKK